MWETRAQMSWHLPGRNEKGFSVLCLKVHLLNQALAMAQQRCPGSLHLACLFGQSVKQLAAETMGFSLLRVQAKLNVI